MLKGNTNRKTTSSSFVRSAVLKERMLLPRLFLILCYAGSASCLLAASLLPSQASQLATATQGLLKEDVSGWLLARLSSLVVERNEATNLVSRKDCTFDSVWRLHVLPSLALLPRLHAARGRRGGGGKTRVIDVGTGGGFPGLPLAIAMGGLEGGEGFEFVLLDSRGKKIESVELFAESLGLGADVVKPVHARSEEYRDEGGGGFDFVLGRSVAALPKFCGWTKHLLREGGQLVYIKGGDIAVETGGLVEPVEDFELLPGLSDKRGLVFEREQVQRLAKIRI